MVSEGTKGRFTLTGKVQEGDCSFSISNAQPADQGFYEFRFHDGNHKYFYQNNRLHLTVTDAPASPTISNCTSAGCRVEVIEGTSLSLLCSAESNPPANLSWAKTGQNSTDPLNSSSGRLDVSHVTTDNGGDYMCRAMNEHGNSTASVRVVITSK
ncbi:sialic acid-binding Ig-like lectin 5 [Xenopus tropicalis]|uniref:Sialic acid-binding Ig-like lectin 5 n=1 Tax=Xenopus tropicalis TaxID=8364 RepID=A0A8J1JZJ6_XENTR|nr:sialic acid-binding Ig-like lectin 5 [Xenopus tropicalis]